MKLTDIVTDNNNDFDSVQVLGSLAFVFFLSLSTYTVITTKSFDPLTYATGAGALIAAIGAGTRLKSGQSPTTPQ